MTTPFNSKSYPHPSFNPDAISCLIHLSMPALTFLSMIAWGFSVIRHLLDWIPNSAQFHLILHLVWMKILSLKISLWPLEKICWEAVSKAEGRASQIPIGSCYHLEYVWHKVVEAQELLVFISEGEGTEYMSRLWYNFIKHWLDHSCTTMYSSFHHTIRSM